MADGYLNFDTKINEAGFNKGIAALGRAVSGIGNTVTGLGKSFTPISVAVAGVGAAAAKTTIDFTKLYESSMVVFEKMLGGKQAANELYGSLLSIAKASTFSQEAFLTAGKKLVGMGVDAQSTTKYMQAITDAVAGFGGTSENLTNVAENFAKISTAGRLSMEDVNMLTDNGINALKILGNQYGVTTDEIRDMISSGAVPAKEAMDNLADGIENGTDGVNGMTAAMAGMSMAMKGKTLTGALDSLNSGFRAFALNLTGINPTLKETDTGYEESTKRLQQLTASISTISAILPSVATVFSGVTDAIGSFLDKLIGTNIVFDEATGKWENVGGILGTIQDKLNNLEPEKLEKIGNAILMMAAAGIGLPVLGTGISKIGGVVEGLSKVVGPAEKAIGSLPKTVSGAGANIKDAAKSFGNVKDALLLPLDDLAPKVGSVLGGVAELWSTGPGGKITSNAKDMALNLGNTVGKISPTLQSKFPAATSALTNFTSYIGAWGSTVGEAFQGTIKSVAKFAPGFIKMLKFGAIAGALVAGLGLLQGQFGEQINSFLQTVAAKGPEIITNLCNGITSALPNLISQGAQLINNLLQAITANIPAIITGGIQIIAGLVTGIAQQLPVLIPTALQMVLTIVQLLLQNIPQLINAGLQLLTGLASGIINAIPMLVSAIPTIIQTLVTGIVQSLPTIIMTGIQLIVALATGIVKAIPDLVKMIPEIFKTFVEGIKSVDWLGLGKQILTAIVDGIKSIGSSLWDAITGIFDDSGGKAEEKGRQAGEKYASAVDGTTGQAQQAATNVAGGTVNAFTSTLDANGELISVAAMNMGETANTGLQLANVPGAFTDAAQNAAGGLTDSLNANAVLAGSAGQLIGINANSGVAGTDMPGAFSAQGVMAGQGLGNSLAGQTGTVAGAASQVADSAQSSIANVNLGSAYANAGTQAINGLSTSIMTASSTVFNAAKNAGTQAINGLKSSNMGAKAREEANKFTKAIAQAILSGISAARSASVSLANAVKSSVSGLYSNGYNAGQMFSSGMANGILSGRNGVAAAAASIANAAVQAAKANLDINSPSKVGSWIGEMFDRGIAKGILVNTKRVAVSVEDMSSTIAHKAERAISTLSLGVFSASRAGNRIGMLPPADSGAYGNRKEAPIYVQTKATLVLPDGRTLAEVTTPYVDMGLGGNTEKRRRHLL